MKILLISNLYPNHLQPERGLFTAQKLLRMRPHHEFKVIAPLAFFPLLEGFRQSPTNQISLYENHNGIDVFHPKVWYLPRIGRRINSHLYAKSIRQLVNKIRKDFPFDLIWATWGYPDVVAVVQLAGELDVPVVGSLHGSDVNIGFQQRWCRRAMLNAFAKCRAVIVRSEIMRKMLVREGLAESLAYCVYNGVDHTTFHPLDRAAACAHIGLDPERQYILFVGVLAPIKGLTCLLRAFQRLKDSPTHSGLELLIVGFGPQDNELKNLARHLGIQSHVRFLGRKSHTELAYYYNAANVFCLPSLHEGLPNVILESLSCGIPVVATRVGGIPEILVNADLGLLVNVGDVEDLAEALATVLQRVTYRSKIFEFAKQFDWDHTVATIDKLFAFATAEGPRPTSMLPSHTEPTQPHRRLCIVSRLFPNRNQPVNGRFNLQLGKALRKHCNVNIVAPIGFKPLTKRSDIPRHEDQFGLWVQYPRFFSVPGFNRIISGYLLARCLQEVSLDSDVVIASGAWPDGYASVRKTEATDIPVVIQVIGSDIDLLPKFGIRRMQTLFALRKCQHILSVSSHLRERLISLGISADKITTIHNGIDPTIFFPRDDKVALRRELDLPLDRKLLTYVGTVSEDKGVDLLLRSLPLLPTRPFLVIVGPELERGKMPALARSLGVASDCRFVGSEPQRNIPKWLCAADVFAFASLHEGCPNVVLEALACGIPVVSTNVGAVPQLLNPASQPWCKLVPPGDVNAFAEALNHILGVNFSPADISRTCKRTWDDVAREVIAVLKMVLAKKEVIPGTNVTPH